MDLMKSIYRMKWAALFLLLALVSCKGNDMPVPEEGNMLVLWDVRSEGMADGRTLINDDAGLQVACTPGSGDEAIGIWSAYRLNEDSVKNVLGINEDISLIYSAGSTTGWTYGEIPAFWKYKAVYYFNAYFPKEDALASVANDSTSLKGTYDTETTQTDLMVSRVKVDTNAETFQGSPVRLPMQHALAAIRFQFQTMDGSTMYLQSFSLNNTTAGSGLSTSGTLIYEDDAEWNLDTPVSGSFYEWAYEGSEGLPFNNSKSTAYQQPANDGTEYTENQGYVLILPQTYNGGTKLNFTLDGKPLSADLPVRNFLPGYRYTYLLNITPDNAVTLTCSVMPWTLKEEDIDFVNYVNMDADGQLEWLSGSVNNDTENKVNEVFMNTETIQCSFHIATPEGATWYATLVPLEGNDMNAFTFVDGVGNEKGITTSGQVGEEAILTIKRKNIKEYTRMRLQLIVKDLNGRTFVVHKDVLGSENYIWSQP